MNGWWGVNINYASRGPYNKCTKWDINQRKIKHFCFRCNKTKSSFPTDPNVQIISMLVGVSGQQEQSHCCLLARISSVFSSSCSMHIIVSFAGQVISCLHSFSLYLCYICCGLTHNLSAISSIGTIWIRKATERHKYNTASKMPQRRLGQRELELIFIHMQIVSRQNSLATASALRRHLLTKIKEP